MAAAVVAADEPVVTEALTPDAKVAREMKRIGRGKRKETCEAGGGGSIRATRTSIASNNR